MDFLQRLFGRDIYNLISDYYNPITELARRRKEYINKSFNICLNYIQHTTYSNTYYARYGWYEQSLISGEDRWNLRYDWIKRLRSADIYLNNGNAIKLRDRNKGIPQKYIYSIYDIKKFGHDEDLYKHEYHRELSFETNKMSNYAIEIPTL